MSPRSSMGWLGCIAFLGISNIACVGTVEVGGGGGAGGHGDPPGPLAKADKVDLLLVVDNSRSMADKQEILARVTADLVQSVTNPPCIDANGNIGQPPASPLDPCPPGQVRRHAPIADMHVGVISTSIGGHGSDSCADEDPTSCMPNMNLTNNDKGHLLSRQDACGSAPAVATYQNGGFLAWDLHGSMSPPGTNDALQMAKDIASMVVGVGQIGCGYESQLESWYRFLADPEPYQTISVVNGVATPMGIDTFLLQQRASFLRPDSMLIIVQLTDENDCSINESGQYFMAAQLRQGATPFRMPRPRAECATNPADPCCKSCGEDRGNCPVDPTCTGPGGQIAMLSDTEDSINLRCFNQKRRFGIDFLYPVDRYVNALTQPTIANRAGNLVANPIFSNLSGAPGNAPVRDPGLVFVANISGVPWQLIARNSNDLTQGYKNADELTGSSAWDVVLGNGFTPPTSPFMQESIDSRMGVSPGNTLNGSDRIISDRDDLQYSCIFPIGTPRDCADPNIVGCDCAGAGSDNPLCNGTTQVAAKAYPSPRTMKVVQGIGDQGVLTSICPAQVNDATREDYAYRPVVRALVERISSRL